jgi:hypothetical protein
MADRASFIGGMNVPAGFWRMNATIPLAELVIDDQAIRLRPRQVVAWMLTEFRVELDQVASAYPLRGQAMTAGVGFTLRDGTAAYFWTYSKRDAVLRELSSRGITVDQHPRAASQIWSIRRRKTTATLPTFSRPIQLVAPILVALSLLVVVVQLATADSWWFRLWLIVVWTVCVVTTAPMWWRGRNRST